MAFHGDDFGNYSEEGLGGGAGLGGDGSGDGGDHDGAGFGLPPGIDDGTAVATDLLAIPHPGFGVDGLTYGAQKTQAFHFVFLGPLVSPLGEGANGCGSGVEDVDLMAVDDRPEAVR